MSHEFEKFIAQNLDAFNDQDPAPQVLSRIEERIAKEKAPTQEKKGIVISFRTLRWAAAACLIVLTGTLAFWMGREYDKTPAQPIASAEQTNNNVAATKQDPIKTEIAPAENNTPVQVADHQVNLLEQKKQNLFASLGNMQSASARMDAAMKAYSIKNPDKEIVDALVTTMNSDPSTNVRLAALDALSRFHKEGYVKKQLVRSLKKQKDPMVQIELIQLLTRMKETTILDELQKMVNDANTIDAVKDKAYSSILTLGS